MKSIFKAVAIVTIFSVITRALGFLFRIFLSRKLGAVGLGIFQLSSSILGLFLTLVSSGLPLTTAKLVSKYNTENDLVKKSKVVASALLIAIFVAMLSSFAIYILKDFWNIILTDNRAVQILIILIPSILFSAVYAIFRGALWGENDYFNCGLTELIEQLIRFALTFIFLLNITDTFIAAKNSAIAFNLTCLISALITIIIYFKKSGKLLFKTGQFKEVIKSSAPVTGIRVANSFVQPLTSLIIPNMLVLSGFSTSDAIGSYGVVMGMTFPLLFVPMTLVGSISMVLIPSISSLMSKNNYSQIEQNITNSLEISIFISIIFVVLYSSVGDLIGIILYNNTLSGILLQLAGICVLPITLCNLTGSLLDALNLEVKSFKNYIIGSILLLTCLVILTPIIGINSVIISFFLSMSTISLLNLAKIKKAVPNFNFKYFKLIAKYFLISVPSSLLGNLVAKICLNFFTQFFAGLMGGLVSIICVFVLIQLFNLYDISQIKQLIKRKKKTV